jgi:hypothetical protein
MTKIKNEPIAHVVFVNHAPHSVMLRDHAIEIDDELIYSIPVYEKPQQPWTSINEIQFKVLAKQFGYVKEKK